MTPYELEGKSLVSIDDLNQDQIDYLMSLTSEVKRVHTENGAKNPIHLKLFEGRSLACLFYEPSTRTSSSFIAAMQRLGGTVIPITQGVDFSSVSKGESLTDTVRTLAQYSDVVVLRHPEAGSAAKAAKALKRDGVPLINAGDGEGEHPTQALLDLFTIKENVGQIEGKHVVFVGDLMYGRTVHSLVKLLLAYDDVTYSFVSPPGMEIPRDLLSEVRKRAKKVSSPTSISSVIRDADVIYMTRSQVERHQGLLKTLTTKILGQSYCLSKSQMRFAKTNLVVMHPFPRLTELDTDLDQDPRVIPFKQIENGMYLRMALLAALLGEDKAFQPVQTLSSRFKKDLEQEDEDEESSDEGDLDGSGNTDDVTDVQKSSSKDQGNLEKEKVKLREILSQGGTSETAIVSLENSGPGSLKIKDR